MNELGKVTDSATQNADAAGSSPTPGAERRVLRVWMVDDHDELRDSFAQSLNADRWFRVSRQFSSLQAVLDALAEERPPHVILLDLNLGAENGLSGIVPIKKLAPTAKVVMFTTFTNTHAEAEAFRLGASGFLLKIYEVREIMDLIRQAVNHPEDTRLFPNLPYLPHLLKRATAEKATAPPPSERPGFLSALRQLCRPRRRQAAH